VPGLEAVSGRRRLSRSNRSPVRQGPLRIDGRRIIPAYLFEVKKPEEPKCPWDYCKLVATVSPEDAARPLWESECPLVKK
jgi:branched-chain amino acid transport system substrate-binding protein